LCSDSVKVDGVSWMSDATKKWNVGREIQEDNIEVDLEEIRSLRQLHLKYFRAL